MSPMMQFLVRLPLAFAGTMLVAAGLFYLTATPDPLMVLAQLAAE